MSAISLGTYKQGEIPLDLVYGFTDFDGAALNLTGYTVKAVATDPLGVDVTVPGSLLVAASGTVTVPWTTDMTDVVGPWLLDVWVDDGTQTLSSARIVYHVAAATAPAF